jgi:hypothetical protein
MGNICLRRAHTPPVKASTPRHDYFGNGDGKSKINVRLLWNVGNGLTLEMVTMLAVHHDVAFVIYETRECLKQS